MRREAKKYLYDIQQATELIVGFTAGKTLVDYQADAIGGPVCVRRTGRSLPPPSVGLNSALAERASSRPKSRKIILADMGIRRGVDPMKSRKPAFAVMGELREGFKMTELGPVPEGERVVRLLEAEGGAR
jgi:hypothetical protein